MADGSEPPERPGRHPPIRGFPPAPFTRLARAHALLAAGDAMVAVSLAGSLFFDLDPSAARPKVALYLLLTVAPFAIVAPFIGPALDRAAGGRRLIVIVSAAGRAVIALLLVGFLDRLFLFPLAFAFLVLARAYAVSKSALVPTYVRSETGLVEANAKLGLLAGLAGFVAGVPALLLKLIDSRVTVAAAALVFTAAAIASLRLPRVAVAEEKAALVETAELRSSGIVLAASAMAMLRATVGFLVFFLAFWLRGEGASSAWFGVAVVGSAAGTFAGNALGPVLRRSLREELMLAAALAFTSAAGLLAALAGGPLFGSLLATALGASAATARLAFDAIVQRDAPDANRGRAFAQFETRFQLAWVAAAVVPVIVPIPGTVGFLIVAALAGFATVSYLSGMRRVRAGATLPPRWSDRLWHWARDRASRLRRPGSGPGSGSEEGEAQA